MDGGFTGSEDEDDDLNTENGQSDEGDNGAGANSRSEWFGTDDDGAVSGAEDLEVSVYAIG